MKSHEQFLQIPQNPYSIDGITSLTVFQGTCVASILAAARGTTIL